MLFSESDFQVDTSLSDLNFLKSNVMGYINIQYDISMNITIYSKLSSLLHNSSSSKEVSYKTKSNGNFSINKFFATTQKSSVKKSFF